MNKVEQLGATMKSLRSVIENLSDEDGCDVLEKATNVALTYNAVYVQPALRSTVYLLETPPQ